jgi:ubiquinone/menaquinone biosynthesis C-methylase UbiE
MNQTDIFLAGEGDAWFARNRDKIGDNDPAHDPVETEIQRIGLWPTDVLEIGCADGWRLKRLQDKYHCRIRGIDPSGEAIDSGGGHAAGLTRGTATHLPFPASAFDLVIFGFCLYLAEPSDLFHVAAEADRVLHDRGALMIYDFGDNTPPFARPYGHKSDVLSYHIDHAQLWLAHPWYVQLSRTPYPDGLVTTLRKNTEAIPVLP